MNSDKKAAKPVDCEKCQHFSGRNGWARVEWGCAEGHAAESTFVLMRYQGCADYAEASRDELIFRRFKASASFHGNADLKQRQTQAKRTANGLAKALAEFGDLMDGAQVKAGREAVAALNRLAADIAQASAMAEAFKKREDEAREFERRKRGDALADRLLSGWADGKVIECAESLAAFDTAAAHRWSEKQRGRALLLESGVWAANDLAQRWKRAPESAKAELLAEVRREVAQALASLDQPLSPAYATRQDFEAYEAFRRAEQAAKASVAALVAEAEKRVKPGEGE